MTKIEKEMTLTMETFYEVEKSALKPEERCIFSMVSDGVFTYLLTPEQTVEIVRIIKGTKKNKKTEEGA